MKKRVVRDLDTGDGRVLVRVDFNVPMQCGRVADDTRITRACPTIELLKERGSRIILVSHLGRPKGRVKEDLRMDPVAERLGEILKDRVAKADDVVGPSARAAVSALGRGEVVLLENVRFYPEEETNDEGFAREMASLANFFVNDAFGAAHRAHASTAGVTRYLPSVAGLLMSEEIENLERLLENPDRPFVALLGGAKVSDKIGVIRNLLGKADAILLGGGMANTFLRASGFEMSASLVDSERVALASELLNLASRGSSKIMLPLDLVVAGSPSDEEATCVPAQGVPEGLMALDIGPRTCEAFSRQIFGAGTVFWNGPMGVYENLCFAKGTREMAMTLAGSRGITVVGGGDSIAALKDAGVANRISHLSTGGGASLEFLEGRPLPGIEALLDAK